MRIHRLLLASILFAPFVSQAEPVPGATANLTIALTEYRENFVSGSPARTLSKLVKVRYGNRQLLEDLLQDGVLGEQPGIGGWKIVVIDRSPLAESDGSSFFFYAVKKGQPPVLVPEKFIALQIDGAAAEGRDERFRDGNTVSLKTSFKANVRFTGLQAGGTGENAYERSYVADAIASGGDSRAIRKLKRDGETFEYLYTVIKAIGFRPLVGVVTNELAELEADDRHTPLEGFINFSAFSALDITDYPAPLVISD